MNKVFKEYKIKCPYCNKTIGFTVEDVWTSYLKGLESGDGWPDYGSLWHYITCINCNKTIAVNNDNNIIESEEDNDYLIKKYEKSLNKI